MSILGESIKKVASLEEEASDRTTSAVVKLGQLYAETYTRMHQEAEKVAELLGDRLPQATKEAQEGAVSNISAFLFLEKNRWRSANGICARLGRSDCYVLCSYGAQVRSIG